MTTSLVRRAYCGLTIKSVDAGGRIIRGIATTPTTDRHNDIVEPLGVSFTNPLALLWQHDHKKPIGWVKFEKPTKDGIRFEAEVADIEDEGRLKDRLDEAWQEIKIGLVRFVSIGFRSFDDGYVYMENGGIRFLKTEVYELSPVTIPANADSMITYIGKSLDASSVAVIKKFDIRTPAASGVPLRVSKTTPAASGTVTYQQRPKEGLKTMNIGAKIAELQAQRKEIADQMEAIQKTALDAGRTKDADERETFSSLRDQLSALDAEIDDLKALEKMHQPTATGLERNAPSQPHRQSVPAAPKKKEQPGVRFAQLAKVLAISRMDVVPQIDVAAKMYGRDSAVFSIIKANEVAPGTTTTGNWAAPLIGEETSAVADFAEYLNPRTILGRFGQGDVPALRQVTFRSPLLLQTDGGDGYWVGEAKPKPLTSFGFDRNTLEPVKCANIAVLSMEHLRDSAPSSDIIVRDALVNALIKVQDIAFIDPMNAGSTGVRPASVLYQAPAIVSEGNDYTDVDIDLRSVVQKFIDADNALGSGVWVMSQQNAMALAMMRNELGQPVFAGMSMRGGVLLDLPVITSRHAGSIVALINAEDIHYADYGDITVDLSREASLEMKSATLSQDPLAPGTGAELVSLWQNNLVALKAERTVNWRRRRPVSAAYLTGVSWGGGVNAS